MSLISLPFAGLGKLLKFPQVSPLKLSVKKNVLCNHLRFWISVAFRSQRSQTFPSLSSLLYIASEILFVLSSIDFCEYSLLPALG